MHIFLWKLVRYCLWLLLLCIILLLLIGLSKNNWDAKGYIQTLNQKSWVESRQQWGISGIFWDSNVSTGDFIGTGGEDISTWAEDISTGIDVYDPDFEQDLNQITQDSFPSGDLSDLETGNSQTGFGFVPDSSGASTVSGVVVPPTTWDSRAQLLKLIKQREMNK